MGLRIIPPKRVRKVKTANSQEVLERLEEYLENNNEEPVQILCGFWQDQQNAITYQELRQAVLDGTLSKETIELWRQDYSKLISGRLKGLWTNAVIAGASGQPILDDKTFVFNTQTPGMLKWIHERGAQLVTACTKEQKEAISALVAKKMKEGHTVDELSRLIRPCIGLTKGDAQAAAKLYDSIIENLKKEHPRMKPENMQRKALDATCKYAERKHRQRAMTIAQTESAFAYNRGADEGIRQAQQQGYLGIVKKRWSTSGDDRVCSTCQALEGIEIEMDKSFPLKGKMLFPGQDLLPPAHPRCACAVEYIEVEQPVFRDIPQMNVEITNEDSFREYSTEEIEDIAKQTEEIASKHISIPSKWSNNMVINDEGIQNSDGHMTYYGKLWNCDILTKHKTAPAIILHEQIHARSISYYGQDTFIQFANIEDASVQLMTEEICKREGIEIIESDYYIMVDSLKRIGQCIAIHKTDYDFAKFMIEMPLTERLDWISDNLYDTLGKNANMTVEDYDNWAALLGTLYTEE